MTRCSASLGQSGPCETQSLTAFRPVDNFSPSWQLARQGNRIFAAATLEIDDGGVVLVSMPDDFSSAPVELARMPAEELRSLQILGSAIVLKTSGPSGTRFSYVNASAPSGFTTFMLAPAIQGADISFRSDTEGYGFVMGDRDRTPALPPVLYKLDVRGSSVTARAIAPPSRGTAATWLDGVFQVTAFPDTLALVRRTFTDTSVHNYHGSLCAYAQPELCGV